MPGRQDGINEISDQAARFFSRGWLNVTRQLQQRHVGGEPAESLTLKKSSH